MAIYDSRDFEEADLAGRFPKRDDIAGVDQWVTLVARLRDLAGQAQAGEWLQAVLKQFDHFLREVAPLKPSISRPRVFVSHQRADAKKAERVAWRATEVDFEYWLDVHDPLLAFANRSTLPAPIKAVLIAAVI